MRYSPAVPKGETMITATLLGVALAAEPASMLDLDFTYSVQGSDGTNGSAVAWDPQSQTYFMVLAGNTEYPLEQFAADGTPVWGGEALFDYRGLWFEHPGVLNGNGNGDAGWVRRTVGADGPTSEPEVFVAGQSQPDAQSIGQWCPLLKGVGFYDAENGAVQIYKKGKLKKTIRLHDVSGTVNTTTVLCTPYAGATFGLLDYDQRLVQWFDKSGHPTVAATLPEDAPEVDYMRFSYANDRVWLYDADARIWSAYLAFK